MDRTSSANRALEREARSFWTLEYIRRGFMDKQLEAIVVRHEDRLVLAELTDFYVRGIILTRDCPEVGEHVKVRVHEINPKLNRLVLEMV